MLELSYVDLSLSRVVDAGSMERNLTGICLLLHRMRYCTNLYLLVEFFQIHTIHAQVYPWGRASDRYGRRPILILGPLGLAITMLVPLPFFLLLLGF